MTSIAQTKPWWQSKTVWGAVAASAGAIGPDLMAHAGLFGGGQGVVHALGYGLALVGTVTAIYGRFAATAQLTAS